MVAFLKMQFVKDRLKTQNYRITVNLALEAEPFEVRMVITPDEAPTGICITSWVPLLEVTDAGLPFNRTVAPVKLEPVIVIRDPTVPDVFERLVILGESETAGTLAG
jgi:hypothetical protein